LAVIEPAGIDPSTMTPVWGTVPPTLEGSSLAVGDGLVMPLDCGLFVLADVDGGRDEAEVGRAPVTPELEIMLGPEAVEPEGAVEELAGDEPPAGGAKLPVAAGVMAEDDREPPLGTGTCAGPASIWAAGVEEARLGAGGTG
jgi:hypothetical protein